MKTIPRLVMLMIATMVLALPTVAQTFTTLHSFADYDGNNPQAGLVLSGDALYGATDRGGTYGTVFKINTNGTGFTTLHDFSGGTDGQYPDGTLVFSGNVLYGTTYWGGANGNGAVFKINTNGTGFTNLHSFAAGSGSFPYSYINSDGAGPGAKMILSGNTLYGTTEKGGASGYGTVFRVNTDGSGFANLHSFTNGSDGSNPECLVLSGNTLYGTTVGISGNGTVFALNTNGTGFVTLHTFTAVGFVFAPSAAPCYPNSDGVLPAGLTLSDSKLYGTTYYGGANGNGTVFAINTNGTGFTNLHNFAATSGSSYTNREGAHPIMFDGLVLANNKLFGTANCGGTAGNGTVFAINTDGTGFTNLHNFSATSSGANSDGAHPCSGLTLSNNTLYGTATAGGANGNGTVFCLSVPAFASKATNITPANGATGVSIAPILAWSDDGSATSYDVYFNGQFKGNQTARTYNPGTLTTNTVYTWRIDTRNSFGVTTGDTWSFTSYAGLWQLGPSLQTARDQFAGGVLNGKLIVFGGNGNPNGENLSSTEILDSAIGVWEYKADNNNDGGQGVEELTGAVANGKFYAFGAQSGGCVNFVEEYDPSSNTWTSKAPMPTTRASATAVAYNNKIYLFGGYYEDDYSARTNYDEVIVYDPANNTWATETHMPQALMSSAIAVVGNKAYVIGGLAGDPEGHYVIVNTVSVYDFIAHTWSTNSCAPLPHPAGCGYSSAAPVKDGKIYMIGEYGDSITNLTPCVYIYDTVANTWAIGDPLPGGQADYGFKAIIGNELWVVGGDIAYAVNDDGDDLTSAAVWKHSLSNSVVAQYSPPGFTYTSNADNTIKITGFIGTGGDVIISNLFNGAPVTSIECGAFSNCASVTSITISGNITNIGASAFASCPNLTAIYFTGNAPKTFGAGLFTGDSHVIVYYLPGHTGWTNSFGGLTPVLWNPQADSLGVRTNCFGFTITGPTNATIVVQCCTNLDNAVWTPIATQTLSGGSSSFSDSHWTNRPAGFYRFSVP